MARIHTLLGSTGSQVNVTGEKVRADAFYGFTDGLHTVSMHPSDLTGRVYIQATLSTNPTESDWCNIEFETLSVQDSTFTVAEIALTPGQTVIPVPGGYTPGLVLITLNGISISPYTDYTGVDGETVTLNLAAELDDVLQLVIFSAFKTVGSYYTDFVKSSQAVSLTFKGNFVYVRAKLDRTHLPSDNNDDLKYGSLTKILIGN